MDLNLVINAIKAEMKPSMGCTEPVALALAVSRTCEHLDAPTQKLEMLISSNIFKNAYSVQIPNAGTYGIELACVLGMLLSKPAIPWKFAQASSLSMWKRRKSSLRKALRM